MSYCVICGSGEAPELIAKKITSTGEDVFLILLKEANFKKELKKFKHKEISFCKTGEILKLMKENNVKKVIIIGGMKMPNFSEIKPDLVGSILLTKILMLKNKGDDVVLRKIAEFIESKGFEVIDGKKFIENKNYIIETNRKPNSEELNDISIGINALNIISETDVGQAIVISSSRIIGIEAVEGTDLLIERCGKYNKKNKRFKGKMILIKLMKNNQDKKLDAPTIGIKTIKLLKKNNFSGIAIRENETIFLNKEKCINFANKNNLFIYLINC